jgi:hypothetical protein
MSKDPSKWGPQKKRFYSLWKETGFAWDQRAACMVKAGYAETSAKTGAFRRDVSKSIQEHVISVMDRKGLTLSKVVETHRDQLGAMSAANPKMPDNGARIKAVDMAYKIIGAYPDPKIQIEKRSISVNIDMDTLMDAQEASGERIIDIVPEELLEEGQEEGENLLREHEQEPGEALDTI